MSSPLEMANQVCNHPSTKSAVHFVKYFSSLLILLCGAAHNDFGHFYGECTAGARRFPCAWGSSPVHDVMLCATVCLCPAGSSYVAAPDGSRTPVSPTVHAHIFHMHSPVMPMWPSPLKYYPPQNQVGCWIRTPNHFHPPSPYMHTYCTQLNLGRYKIRQGKLQQACSY